MKMSFANPFRNFMFPDYTKRLETETTQALYQAKRDFISAQQAEQYYTVQREYFATRVRTLSDTLERLKGPKHETLVNPTTSISIASTGDTITINGQGATLLNK
jgi:hypothetical protein